MEKKLTHIKRLQNLSLVILVGKLLMYRFVYNMAGFFIRGLFIELRAISYGERFTGNISTRSYMNFPTKGKKVNITYLENKLKISYSMIRYT